MEQRLIDYRSPDVIYQHTLISQAAFLEDIVRDLNNWNFHGTFLIDTKLTMQECVYLVKNSKAGILCFKANEQIKKLHQLLWEI